MFLKIDCEFHEVDRNYGIERTFPSDITNQERRNSLSYLPYQSNMATFTACFFSSTVTFNCIPEDWYYSSLSPYFDHDGIEEVDFTCRLKITTPWFITENFIIIKL